MKFLEVITFKPDLDLLNPMQRMAYPFVKWLYSNDSKDQASGRSVLLATVLIEKAITHPGSRVQIRDHFGHHLSDRMLKDKIFVILRENPLLYCRFKFFDVSNEMTYKQDL